MMLSCHHCRWAIPASSLVCHHCGAIQDEQGRLESAVNWWETLIIVSPALILMLGGGLWFQTGWAVAIGFALGIVLGLGTVAAKYVLQHK
jgi:hypothetical protein